MRSALLLLAAGVLSSLPVTGRWKAVAPTKSGDKRSVVLKEKRIPYWRLDPASPIEVKVKGRVRLRIRVRREVKADSKAAHKLSYSVAIDKDVPGKRWTLRHEALVRRSKTARFDGEDKVVPSGPDGFVIELPKGEHTVTVTVRPGSRQVLYARIYVQRKARR